MFIIVSLYTEIVGPAFTFLIGVIVLGIFGILAPKEILSGMANEQVAVIILLLLIGDIIRKTDIIDWLLTGFPKHQYLSWISIKNDYYCCRIFCFLNNTPLVAIMMPYVHSWGKRNNVAPSKLLIPFLMQPSWVGVLPLSELQRT
ncbi:MAG: SLC13 family permease [Bacteroidales bacterium]